MNLEHPFQRYCLCHDSEFGLRRMLIGEQGNHKGQLEIGEQKSITTDRIILVPGPDEKIRIVNWIYTWYSSKNEYIKKQKKHKKNY